MPEINFLIVFGAGLISFFAPCVIPLVPAYISYISGVSIRELLNENSSNKYHTKVLINSLFYIAGFSTVFVCLGLTTTYFGKFLLQNRFELLQLGGILVIIFGVYSLGLLSKLKFLQSEFGFQIPNKLQHIKLLSPFLLGTSFALAWTPCIGPILGSVLTLAASADSVLGGGLLLFVYSLGIALPFLVIGFTLSNSYKLLHRMGPLLVVINKIGAIFLIVLGVMMLTHTYDDLSMTLLRILNSFALYRNLQNYF